MAYTITKIPDGDCNLGNLNGEFVNLQPSSSDYATGGYAINSQEAVLNNSALTANCDLYKIITVLPAGGQGGLNPKWNPTTGKLQIWETGSENSPEAEFANGGDLSAYTFLLLLVGN
jgi:hypothetical protein